MVDRTTSRALVAGVVACFAMSMVTAQAQVPTHPTKGHKHKPAPPQVVHQAADATRTAKQLGTIEVIGHQPGSAANAQYEVKNANLGPLGPVSILDTPFPVTVVPLQFMVNQQAETVNQALRYLPSVEVRDQQGMQVSRPQSRGFVGSIAQQTRLDGLNIIGTTAIPAENLSGIQVLNGLAGSLYGPESPAGVFNYVLKRAPTRGSLVRYTQNYGSNSVLTGHLDVGGRAGRSDKFGYRLNLVHGKGHGYVGGSQIERSLFSGAFDYAFSDRTVFQSNLIYYKSGAFGFPGAVVYGGSTGTLLPRTVDPSRKWLLGQPGAGNQLNSATALARLKHNFGSGWQLEVGYLWENAIRKLHGITNRFTDNLGNFDVIKNFDAISRYRINSNTVRLNGHVDLFGTRNDVTFATNGFNLWGYHHPHSISQSFGSGNINHPTMLPIPPELAGGGDVKSFNLRIQSLIAGDTLHFNSSWAMQGVLSSSIIRSTSYAKDGHVTKSDRRNGKLSPTFSLIYTPTSRLTLHATWAKSVEEGRAAPTGTVNAGQFLAPFHDKEYEIGAKFAATDKLLLTFGSFLMTQPLAATSPTTNVYRLIGTQRNTGVEFFAQGSITPALSILGGATYVNARVDHTRIPADDGNRVIGVPRIKTDISLDYHPGFFHGLAITGSVHAESRRAATITNDSYAPGYGTCDLGLRYSTRIAAGHRLIARFQVINLTNVHYYSALAGGNIVGSPGADTAYYGAPRTFRASVAFDF